MRSFLAIARDEGARLDVFLKHRLEAWSRPKVRALCAQRRVRVNGAGAAPGTRLRAGDVIEITGEPLATELPLAAPELPLVLRYESEACLVADKPAGMPAAPLSPEERGTLVNALVARYPSLRGVGPKPLEAGLVHRLDNDTSGLLLVAKDERASRELWRQANLSKIIKTYLALVHGAPPREGRVTWPIEHDRTDRRRMRVLREASATSRRACTFWRVLAQGDASALLEVTITRGARHQIRAHLGDAGWPIVADALYGRGIKDAPYLAGRHFLHAAGLSFEDPAKRARVTVSSPLPPELVFCLRAFRVDLRDLSRAYSAPP